MPPHLLDPDLHLPSSADLPCSDDTPVDNENQNTLPNWLLAVLEDIWGDRQDWFFGVDMAVYNREGQAEGTPTVVPDGFLSLGVERHKRADLGRLSYVLQEENGIVPILALEMVSKTSGQEYDQKLHNYERLGVKYYVIYNREYSRRDEHQPFEVYKLVNRRYRLQRGEPCWMPEVGLGIGRVQGTMGGITQEWLAWHNLEGTPYPLPTQVINRERRRAEQLEQALQQQQQRVEQEQKRAEQERKRAEQERKRAEQAEQEKSQLLEKLRQLGIDSNQL